MALLDDLEGLAELLASGAISQEEFNVEKARILAELNQESKPSEPSTVATKPQKADEASPPASTPASEASAPTSAPRDPVQNTAPAANIQMQPSKAASMPYSPPPNSDSDDEFDEFEVRSSGKPIWLFALVGLLVLGAGGYVMLGDSGNESVKASDNSATLSKVESSQQLVDSPKTKKRFKLEGIEKVLAGFVRVKAADFTIGSPPNERHRADDENQVRVSIPNDYYIGKYEVTHKEFQSLMGGSSASSPQQPASGISWLQATRYANKLSASFGLQQCYRPDGSFEPLELIQRCNGFRLPTEAEWEYAARGGQNRADYLPSFSNGWFKENSNGEPHEVGQKRPNALGLYDMLGNAVEWCHDDFRESYHPIFTQRGMKNTDHPTRVWRGGSWRNASKYGRAANRGFYEAHKSSPSSGFRLAKTAKLYESKLKYFEGESEGY